MLVPEVFMLSERARSSYAWAFVLAARTEPGEPLRERALQAFTGIPLSKQHAALEEMAAAGMVTIDGDTFTLPAFDEMQKPVDEKAADRVRNWRERNALRNGVTNGERNAFVTRQEEQKNRYTPTDPNGSVPPGVSPGNGVTKRQRVAPVLLDATFGEMESLVVSVLANDAAQRRDGKIADSVVASLRQKLARHRERHGLDALRHGLEVALDKGHGVDYACGVARNHRPGENGFREPVREERQYDLLIVPRPQ